MWQDFENELSKGGELSDVPVVAAITVASVEGGRGSRLEGSLAWLAFPCWAWRYPLGPGPIQPT
jgi:hypothetical protein